MTIYQCHCGKVHDSATTAPCPQTVVTTPLYMLSELDRFVIVSALRARHPSPTPNGTVANLIAALSPTKAEMEANAAYAREMARQCRDRSDS